VVSDACVWAYVGVGAYLAVLIDYDWSADRGSAVDYCAFADSDVVGEVGAFLESAVADWSPRIS